jgi:hypothetical protein
MAMPECWGSQTHPNLYTLNYDAMKQGTPSAQAAYNDFMALKNDPSHVATIDTTTGGMFIIQEHM